MTIPTHFIAEISRQNPLGKVPTLILDNGRKIADSIVIAEYFDTLAGGGVMERRLGRCEYLAGDRYTIADVASFPWVRRYERHAIALADYPNVSRWYHAIAARPAVIAGLKPLADGEQRGILADAQSHDLLFGTKQFSATR